jgi:Protein of unknown function (DUF2846)
MVASIAGPLRVALLLLSLILPGCAGSAPNFKPAALQPGAGVIYVYWPAHMLLGNHKTYASVAIDGKKIGDIGTGMYYAVPATPGKHVISFNQAMSITHALLGDEKLTVNVAGGQSTYVRLTTVMHTATAQSFYLRKADPERARAELAHTTRG